jgi:hypothetical protein
LSHGQSQGGQRTANVTQLNTGATPPQVSFTGESYWAGCSAVRLTQDHPWTRFDKAYMTEVIPSNAPRPEILLCGDVERNPGPQYGRSTDSLEISDEDLLDMNAFQEDKIQERLRDASDCKQGPPLIYPRVLHPSEGEREECHVLFHCRVPHHIFEALANLALPEEVAEPSFLLMINRTEAVFDVPAEAKKLEEYGPMAIYLLNCLTSVMDVTPEQSLNLILMTCIQQRMKGMHEREARSTASIVNNMKMKSSEFLVDVVQLGLVRGSLQVEMKDLRHVMEAAGRTTRSQVHD